MISGIQLTRCVPLPHYLVLDVGGEFASIKQLIHTDPEYEKYLYTQKKDLMEKYDRENLRLRKISTRIKKGEDLYYFEKQDWAKYNFENLRQREKEDIIYYFKRRNNMRLFCIIISPLVMVPSYTYFKRYYFKGSIAASTYTAMICFGLSVMLNYIPQKRLNTVYSRLFNKYKCMTVPKRKMSLQSTNSKISDSDLDDFSSTNLTQLREAVKKIAKG